MWCQLPLVRKTNGMIAPGPPPYPGPQGKDLSDHVPAGCTHLYQEGQPTPRGQISSPRGPPNDVQSRGQGGDLEGVFRPHQQHDTEKIPELGPDYRSYFQNYGVGWKDPPRPQQCVPIADRRPRRAGFWNGTEAPKTRDLTLGPRPSTDSLPLHLKKVAANIDTKKLESYAEEQGEEIGGYVKEAFRWLHDVSLYQSLVPPIEQQPAPLPSKLLPSDLQDMVAAGRVTELALDEVPKGTVHLFTVDEVDKGRRRIILDATINRYVEKFPPMGFKIRLPSRQECRADVLAAETQAQLDYEAYYDQFPLDPEVQLYFCFQSQGKWWKWLRLPMGFTHSCAVACAATWTVAGKVERNLDPSRPGTNMPTSTPKRPHDPGSKPAHPNKLSCTPPPIRRTYIDNLRYAGAAKQAAAYTEEFKRVSQQVRATLNKEEGERTEESFLGEVYCFSSKTKASTPKTVGKLTAALALLDEHHLQRKKWAAIFGIVFYACPTSDIPLSSCYDLLLFYRKQVCSAAGEWSQFVGAPPSITTLLRELLRTLILNVPTPCKPEAAVTELGRVHIVTDASAWGWGALTWMDGDEAFVDQHAQEWPPSGIDMRPSTVAEPLAAQAAVYRFVSLRRPPTIPPRVHQGARKIPHLQPCNRCTGPQLPRHYLLLPFPPRLP